MAIEFDLTIVDKKAIVSGTFTMDKLIPLKHVSTNEIALIHDLVQDANKKTIHRTAETTVNNVTYAVKIAGSCSRECTCF